MARVLSSVMQAQIASGDVKPVLFFEGDIAGTTLRLWSGSSNIEWDGKTWLGNGWLHGISSLKGDNTLAANGASITLSGVPSELIAAMLSSLQQGAIGRLWLGFVGNDKQVATFTSANTERLKRTDNASLSITGNMTISAWLKVTSVTTQQFMVAKWGGAGARSYAMSVETNSKVNFSVSNDGTATPGINSTETISANTWVHAVGRYNGTNIAIILNAGTPTTLAHSSGIFDSTNDFFIGARGSGTLGNINGNIRNVGIWNAALTDAQVAMLYNDGYPVYYSDLSNQLKAGLVSYWNLDEFSSGTGAITRNDSHTTGNHLTDENTVTSVRAADTLLRTEPLLLFTGLLDRPTIRETTDAPLIELTYESELIRLGTANVHRYTDEGQRAFYPNDRGFEYVAFLEQWNGYWGRQETRDNE